MNQIFNIIKIKIHKIVCIKQVTLEGCKNYGRTIFRMKNNTKIFKVTL